MLLSQGRAPAAMSDRDVLAHLAPVKYHPSRRLNAFL
jgi:hypothetical protein